MKRVKKEEKYYVCPLQKPTNKHQQSPKQTQTYIYKLHTLHTYIQIYFLHPFVGPYRNTHRLHLVHRPCILTRDPDVKPKNEVFYHSGVYLFLLGFNKM